MTSTRQEMEKMAYPMRWMVVLLLFWVFTVMNTSAQDRFYILGGTIHTGTGQVIENGYIRVDEGKITDIGDRSMINIDPSMEVVDAGGKHIYPGLIAPNTILGLNEIDAVKATIDYKELGEFNPSVRTIIAYNTDSEIIPTIRSNGILYAQIVPRGGLISGSSSVTRLEGWNWEDAVVRTDDGLHVHWPARHHTKGWWAEPGGTEKNEQYFREVAKIEQFMIRAQAYCSGNRTDKNLKMEAMCGLFDGSQTTYLHVNGDHEMIHAVETVLDLGMKPVIVGGKDSYKVTAFLKEHEVPVILAPIHGLPVNKHDDIDQPYRTPRILEDAGILYCLSLPNAWEQRNLMFVAGSAAAYGLTKEQALAAVSLNTARILGISDRLGSLEIGKDASLVISTGDLLDMRTSVVEKAWIDGKEVDLNNRQKELYEKFSRKYEEGR